MWYPIKIEFFNLFAHEHTAYSFNNGVCTVIFGENLDAEDCENNGAGKSTIFEAIAIALTNKSLRDLDKEVFINRDAEDCEISFELKNDVLNKSMKIVRKFFRGSKSAKIQIWENGKLNSQLTSVNEANKYIFTQIGISREDLLRYYIISQDNGYTFFTAGDVEKKDVLNRITSADMINPIIEKLQIKKKECNSDLVAVDLKLNNLSDRIELIKEQIIQNNSIGDDYEIRNKKERIEIIKSEIKDFEARSKKLSGNISEVEKLISQSEATLVSVDDLKERRKKLKKGIEKIDNDIDESKSIIRKLSNDIDGVLECPNCHTKFIKDSEFELGYDDSVKMKKETETILSELNERMSLKKSKLKNLNEKISEAEISLEQVDSYRNDKKSYERKLRALQDQINDGKDNIKKLSEDIEKIRKESKTEKIRKELESKKNKLEVEKSELEKESENINNELSMVDYWIYYMGKNGFTTYLANRAVSIIEGITNSYLRKFHSNLSVEINGYKILKDGSVREKIDVRVLDSGISSTVFMGCSGGERGRVSLAGVLGIQHLINLSLDGRGLDLLLLDETFHGVDSRGQENMIKILENVGSTILMITQNVSSEFNSNNKILIRKEDGIAKIIE